MGALLTGPLGEAITLRSVGNQGIHWLEEVWQPGLAGDRSTGTSVCLSVSLPAHLKGNRGGGGGRVEFRATMEGRGGSSENLTNSVLIYSKE